MGPPSPGFTNLNNPLPPLPDEALRPARSVPSPEASSQFRSYRQDDNSTFRAIQASQKSPEPIDDEGAKLLSGNASAYRNGLQNREYPPETREEILDKEDSVYNIGGPIPNAKQTYAAPQNQRTVSPVQHHTVVVDPSLIASARLAAQWEETEKRSESNLVAMAPKSTNKVMTPAQFERYRRQQELTRKKSDASCKSKSDEAESSDEDEAERGRQVAKQRRKQEAHLAVYRQKMMKVTGEQPPTAPLNSNSNGLGNRIASSSTPEITNRTSHLTVNSKISSASGKSSGKSSGDEEEDEDVPLGILAAHGFPNKNKPPTNLTKSSSNPNLRGLSNSVVGTAGSVIGESRGHESRGSLPVFARHLPQDPYYGASLVNPSNREQFTMSGGAPVHVPPPGTMPGLHPGGLVGVIAGEERARALRRGSPNAQGGYDGQALPTQHLGLPRSQTTGNIPTMGFPGIVPLMQPQPPPSAPPVLSPGDQVQLQMSQNMTQMMQMQMQWMQHMMNVQGLQQGGAQQPLVQQQQPSMTASNMLGPGSQIQRPLSLPIPSSPRSNQRTMSTLDASMASWNLPKQSAPSVHLGIAPGQGYAPSIAPSERSNVGLASRYRPVTNSPDAVNGPSNPPSNHMPGTANTWSHFQAGRQSPGAPTITRPASSGRVVATVPDDEDDDQGWAEMKKKRDKEKSSRKMKKGQNGLNEILAAYE